MSKQETSKQVKTLKDGREALNLERDKFEGNGGKSVKAGAKRASNQLGVNKTQTLEKKRGSEISVNESAIHKKQAQRFANTAGTNTDEKKEETAVRKNPVAGKRARKNSYQLVRHFDQKTGKVTFAYRDKKVLKNRKKASKKLTAGFVIVGAGAKNAAHGYVSELEKDNDALKAAHTFEKGGERAAGALIKKGVQKAKKKDFRIEDKFEAKKAGKANPVNKNKAMQKELQKQRIKREYIKAAKKGKEAKHAAEYAQAAARKTGAIARKIQEFVRKHIGAIATAAMFLVLFLVISVGISSCASIFAGGSTTFMAGSYQSKPAEIDAAEESLALKEIELQERINGIEEEFPDYDEYNYNLAEIGHNPFTLINYLSALFMEIKADEVGAEIDALFNEMYELTLTPREETRTRMVTKTRVKTDPDTGDPVIDPSTGDAVMEEYEEEEEYTVKILDVKLTAKPLEGIVEERLVGNDEAISFHEIYKNTNGLLQQFYSPLNVDWYSLISSNYGSRLDPFTGKRQFHRGLDIAVPEGTDVFASMSGTVITATYDSGYGNYVVIEDEEGYVTKYAHMSSLNVTAGQRVEHGDNIGKTGNTGASTGSHLHIECLYKGEYYNPLFYFANGEGSIYGDEAGGSAGSTGAYSGDVQALITEAEKYLGMPYVWGGSNPQTSFDCSGFVCYALKQSGYYDISRTTAQGIYDRTSSVSASEARPGDLIFFTGTYQSAGPVSHVGIYVGNGQMIHCGDPISYASINTPYWQSHFYAFGRVSGD